LGTVQDLLLIGLSSRLQEVRTCSYISCKEMDQIRVAKHEKRTRAKAA